MRKAFRQLFNAGYCALALPLLAQTEKAKLATQAQQNGFIEGVKEVAKEWWLWGGILALVGLGGYLYYIRTHQDDD